MRWSARPEGVVRPRPFQVTALWIWPPAWPESVASATDRLPARPHGMPLSWRSSAGGRHGCASAAARCHHVAWCRGPAFDHPTVIHRRTSRRQRRGAPRPPVRHFGPTRGRGGVGDGPPPPLVDYQPGPPCV